MAQTHSLDLERDEAQLVSITDASQTGLDITGSISLEAWVKTESLPAASEFRSICGKGDGTSGGTSYWLAMYNNAGTYQLRGEIRQNGSTTQNIAATWGVATGIWYHVAFVFTASTRMELFVDGYSIGSTTTSIPASIQDTAQPFKIGDFDTSINDSWDGQIKDVRVFSDVRTASEIASDAHTESVSDANLEGEWNFNDALTDASGNGNTLTLTNGGGNFLTSYEGSNDDYENTGTTAGDAGQSFQVSSTEKIYGISIYGSRGNLASGTFKVELLSGSYTSGTVEATTGTLTTTSALSTYGSPDWNYLAFTSAFTPTASTTYYIKLTVISGSATDEIRWSTDTTSPGYANGAYWGAGTENTSRDRNFRVNSQYNTDIPWEGATEVEGSTYLETSLSGFWDFTDGSGSTITDQTGGTNASLTGGTWVSSGPTETPGGVDFDGSSDYAVAATNYNVPSGSLSVWVNLDTNSVLQSILGNGNQGGSGEGDIFIESNKITSITRFTGDSKLQESTSAATGSLTHIVHTWNDTDKITTLYINGVMIDFESAISGSVSNGTDSLYFGRLSGSSARFLNGKIYQGAIYGRVLHYGDVLDLYNGGDGLGFSAGTAYTQDVDETLTVVDTYSNETGKAIDETVTIVDTIARDAQRTLSEIITIIDDINIANVYTLDLDDALEIVDSASTQMTAKTLFEIVTIVDALENAVMYNQSISDALTMVDSVENMAGKSLDDALTMADSLAKVGTFARELNEAIEIELRFQGLLNGKDISWIRKYTDQAGTWIRKYLAIP